MSIDLAKVGSLAIAAGAASAVATTLGAYVDAKYHLSKDIGLMWRLSRTDKLYLEYQKQGRGSAFDLYLENTCSKQDVEAVWTCDGSLTFAQLTSLAYKYANFFISVGVKPQDLVGLNMQNSYNLIAAWFGLWAIGSAPALINCSLKGDALVHCIKISKAKLVLVDGEPEIFQRHVDVQPKLDVTGVKCIDLNVARTQIYDGVDVASPRSLRAGTTALTAAGLFYTSGTTGMPKACIYPMIASFSNASGGLNSRFPARQSAQQDRCYSCMPLYHGTGGMCIMGQLTLGQSICIGKKFSVSKFWDEIRESNATWFVYVGEVLRYLTAAPPSPKDKQHKVHTVFGNGLRPDIWDKFKDRFGIDTILEIFGSTEGVLLFLNQCRGPFLKHSIGHQGALLRWMTKDLYIPVAIDPETGDLWRHTKTGFAKRVLYEEGGEILVKMTPEKKFIGYFGNPEATEKKYARNVFKKGDLYFRTGDALRRDSDGRWFFMDRLGDTFRWKGENVATVEVAQVLGEFEGVREVAVYGVTVPGHDGRAGCAALLLDPAVKDRFDWSTFLKHIRSKLPLYAVPIFIRILPRSIAQHNFKLNKTPLQKEGIDPATTNGAEFLWIEGMGKGSKYVPFSQQEWKSLVAGKSKL